MSTVSEHPASQAGTYSFEGSVFDLRRSNPFAPPDSQQAAALAGPICRVPAPRGVVWAVSGYAEARQVLADPSFSAVFSTPGFPMLDPDNAPADGALSFLRMDPPDHTRLRRMFTGEFTARRMAALRPAIEAMTADLLDTMAAAHAGGEPVDLVDLLALPLPSLVICELLGVPYADHAYFQALSRELVDLSLPAPERQAARDRLDAYLTALIRAKADAPDDGLISRQLRPADGAAPPDERELANAAALLLVAGHETTANMIGLSTLLLLDRPAERARLLGRPDEVEALVEALLRHLTVAQFGVPRAATRDVRIGEVEIRAGEGVLVLLGPANRDVAAFAAPHELDQGQQDRPHLAFGHGIHHCLGQPLARLELRVALPALFGRFAGLRLAVDADELRFREQSIIHGLVSLPVTWAEAGDAATAG